MTRAEIETKVTRLVADQVDAAGHHDIVTSAVPRDQSLLDLGLDELSAVEILMRAEEEFGVEIPDDAVGLDSTLADIVGVVVGVIRNEKGMMK